YNKTPMWLSPMEARHKRDMGGRNWLNYKQILKKSPDGELILKSFEEMKLLDKNITWLQYIQYQQNFKEDNKLGFCQE
ncbi:hypothetical protein, partial [Pseudomonas syringae]|uniref:hypothetical protein n=1 Tax=Pseudomonas syringae TaxID=317 RepID=UPI0034D5A39D